MGISRQWNGSRIGDIRLLNNIFYSTNAASGYTIWDVVGTSNLFRQSDYNLYFNNTRYNNGNVAAWTPVLGVSPFSYSLAQMQSTFGFEQHGIQADPRFVNPFYGLGFQTISNNYRLNTNSPALGSGTNLSAIFTSDL